MRIINIYRVYEKDFIIIKISAFFFKKFKCLCKDFILHTHIYIQYIYNIIKIVNNAKAS